MHLNVWNARVRDFPSRPIYGVGEQSGIKLRRVVPRISWLLVKGFFWRLREKYVIRDFHPLVFFYALGLVMTFAGLLLGAIEVILRLKGNEITTPTIVLVALLLISGSQFTLLRCGSTWSRTRTCAEGASEGASRLPLRRTEARGAGRGRSRGPAAPSS